MTHILPHALADCENLCHMEGATLVGGAPLVPTQQSKAKFGSTRTGTICARIACPKWDRRHIQARIGMAHKALQHICPHCGAVYRMTGKHQHGRRAYHTAVCSYCGDVMAAWDGCARQYHRTKRPSPSTRAARIVAEAAASSPKSAKLEGARSHSSSGRRGARKRNA
jgi:predicted RNA-binding Zn-ribbon protein involved in translation (DUF1610 family)